MNLVLLFPPDFVNASEVRLTGRRARHVREVHRVAAGDTLRVGLLDERMGTGSVISLDEESVRMSVILDEAPPEPMPLTLVLALPRPKVLNRVVASAVSLGIKRIYLINAWRVEKSYWSSPRMEEASLREQAILGLEQARDTRMPSIELRRLFRPFVENELAEIARGTLAIVAHPGGTTELPRASSEPVTLVVGPEGGFIERELDSLSAVGFRAASIGPRILRVETALPALAGRLF
jgi:16S rRNA (uracil1498-N3)-methyltransferase